MNEFDFLAEIRQKGLFIGVKMIEEGFGPLLSLSCYHSGILAVYANTTLLSCSFCLR